MCKCPKDWRELESTTRSENLEHGGAKQFVRVWLGSEKAKKIFCCEFILLHQKFSIDNESFLK